MAYSVAICSCSVSLGQNNKESYKICSSLIDDVQSKGHFMPRHAYCFAVALALRQVSTNHHLPPILNQLYQFSQISFFSPLFSFQNDTENAQALYLQIISTDSRLCQNLRVSTHQ